MMQPVPGWPGLLCVGSGVVDTCINFQVAEGVVRACL